MLDFNEDAIENAREDGALFIEGNGTDDEDLEATGLSTAKGLVASSDSDVDNLYITLSARTARPDLFIVARASDEDVAEKLRRAGADRVVQPYSTAGKEMAALVLKPQVSAFLEIVTGTRRRRPPVRGDRRHRAERAGGPDDPRAPHPARDRRRHRRAAQAGRDLRHDSRPRRGARRAAT